MHGVRGHSLTLSVAFAASAVLIAPPAELVSLASMHEMSRSSHGQENSKSAYSTNTTISCSPDSADAGYLHGTECTAKTTGDAPLTGTLEIYLSKDPVDKTLAKCSTKIAHKTLTCLGGYDIWFIGKTNIYALYTGDSKNSGSYARTQVIGTPSILSGNRISVTINNSNFAYTGLQPVNFAGSCTNSNIARCPMPVGLGAYGSFTANAVLGSATISSVGAMSSDGVPTASLQLNSILAIDTSNGMQYLWPQNVENFENPGPSGHTVSSQVELSYLYSIVSWSGPVKTVTYSNDKGWTNTGTYDGGSPYYEYTYYGPSPQETALEEKLPSTFDSVISIGSVTSSGVVIDFANSLYTGGESSRPFETIFGKIEVSLPNTTIFGASLKGVPGTFQGTEFVWAGDGNGDTATFSSMQSNMSLYYSSSGKVFNPLPATQNYGIDTGESATNLTATPDGNGVSIAVGQFIPGTLANTSTTNSLDPISQTADMAPRLSAVMRKY